MNYILTKQLKDAGFPQKHGDDLPGPYQPTLSELIEATFKTKGYTRFFLEYVNSNEGWYANIHTEGTSRADVTYVSTDFYPTPEEAVANLWLALNKL